MIQFQKIRRMYIFFQVLADFHLQLLFLYFQNLNFCLFSRFDQSTKDGIVFFILSSALELSSYGKVCVEQVTTHMFPCYFLCPIPPLCYFMMHDSLFFYLHLSFVFFSGRFSQLHWRKKIYFIRLMCFFFLSASSILSA